MLIDDARNTRIQHDKFLPENRNTHTPTPPGYTRARGDISKYKEVSEYHVNSSVCVVLRGTRVTLASKKLVTRVTLASNMTSIW